MSKPLLEDVQDESSAEEPETENSHGPSDVAQAIAKLKEAGMKAAREREHPPPTALLVPVSFPNLRAPEKEGHEAGA